MGINNFLLKVLWFYFRHIRCCVTYVTLKPSFWYSGSLEHQAVSFKGQRDQNTSLISNESSDVETDRSISQEEHNSLMCNEVESMYSGASASSST